MNKLSPGDRVAIVSPSWAGPGVFPAVHERALRQIRDELGLVPVEFPTTRTPGASAAERAADLMAAYADPTIRAVFASIGGDDQITVLPHLDPAPFVADPKPYFGYSDNTNLLNWLWMHGVPGFHGGSTMVHLARPADPNISRHCGPRSSRPTTCRSRRSARSTRRSRTGATRRPSTHRCRRCPAPTGSGTAPTRW